MENSGFPFSREYSLSVRITLDDESHHPLSEPAQWAGAYSQGWSSDARALRPGVGFHFEAKGARERAADVR